MRFIITFVWSFILCSAISYILSSMGQQGFSLKNALFVSVLFSVVVYILGEMLASFEQKESKI